jgi:hypothetical protein
VALGTPVSRVFSCAVLAHPRHPRAMIAPIVADQEPTRLDE